VGRGFSLATQRTPSVNSQLWKLRSSALHANSVASVPKPNKDRKMLIVHAASGVLGFYLLYLTFAMRESTEGKWVNRLEELWIQIDEHSRTVGETTRALFGRLAGMVTTLFNRILGRRMISVRVVGISGSLSFASLFFVCGLALEFLVYLVVNYSRVSKNPDASIIALIPKIPIVAWGGLVFLLAAGFFLGLAAFPILFRAIITLTRPLFFARV
jgi:hypothetical protein